MRSSSLTVLCVDDHHLVRDCVVAILEQQPGLRVAGEARTLRASVECFTEARPDVTVVNLQTRYFDSLQVIRALRHIDPCARIVVYAMDDSEAMYGALDAGAAAFVLKDAGAAELIRVIEGVHGRSQEFVDDIRTKLGARTGRPVLTTREVEILGLLAEGLRVKAISAALRISDHTVKAHMRSVYEKLDVHGRAEALAEALRRGLVRLPATRPHLMAAERFAPRAQSLPGRVRRLVRLTPERQRPLHRPRTLASGSR
jgi:two-component system, NarL family, response regulator